MGATEKDYEITVTIANLTDIKKMHTITDAISCVLDELVGEGWMANGRPINISDNSRPQHNVTCDQCENHRHRAGICDVWHAHTPSDGYCYRGRVYGKQEDKAKPTQEGEDG